MRREDRYVPKTMEVDSYVARRLDQLRNWILTYEGLGAPIGLEGLDQLHEFIRTQVSYIAEGGWGRISLADGGFTDVGVYWLKLQLRSLDGHNWGVVNYTIENRWVEAVASRIADHRTLYALKQPGEMAQIPIDAFLTALAEAFTVGAQKIQPMNQASDIFVRSWEQQAGLLRTAHACEFALVELRAKSQAKAA